MARRDDPLTTKVEYKELFLIDLNIATSDIGGFHEAAAIRPVAYTTYEAAQRAAVALLPRGFRIEKITVRSDLAETLYDIAGRD